MHQRCVWIYPVVGLEEDPRQTKERSHVSLSHNGFSKQTDPTDNNNGVLGTTKKTECQSGPLGMINIYHAAEYVTMSAFHVTAASTINTIKHTNDKYPISHDELEDERVLRHD